MSEPMIIPPNGGRTVIARAEIILYQSGRCELKPLVENPNISWVALLGKMSLDLNEQRLSEMAATVGQLLEQAGIRTIRGIDLAEILKKPS
jgi:hypothetical protein